jgi:hypothetical protein
MSGCSDLGLGGSVVGQDFEDVAVGIFEVDRIGRPVHPRGRTGPFHVLGLARTVTVCDAGVANTLEGGFEGGSVHRECEVTRPLHGPPVIELECKVRSDEQPFERSILTFVLEADDVAIEAERLGEIVNFEDGVVETDRHWIETTREARHP